MGSRGGRSHSASGGGGSGNSVIASLQQFDELQANWIANIIDPNLTAAQQKYLRGQLSGLFENGSFSMAVSPYLIEKILDSHFKNLLETGPSGGANVPEYRAQLSAKMFGHGGKCGILTTKSMDTWRIKTH